MLGTIARVLTAKRIGFIDVVGKEGSVFFHRSQLHPDLAFDEQLQFMRVTFDLRHGPKGMLAENIRAAK